MNTQRLTAIDTIRGIAMVAMVLAHTNAYFSGNYWAVALWDYSLFSVHVFIFCSAYLFFTHTKKNTTHYTFTYFKKRIVRLLLPYYIFLAIYCLLLLLFKQTVTLEYVIKSITLTGGIDFNWLVLLFIYFTFLMPLLDMLLRKRALFYAYLITAFCVSLYLLFFKIPVHFKFFMWLPWSLVVFSAWYVVQEEKKKRSLVYQGMIWAAIFFISLGIQYWLGNSLRHYQNKYPPNLYHLSYGIAVTIFLYQLCKTSLIEKLHIQPLFNFLSKHSYSLYFVHIIVLHTVVRFIPHNTLGWPLFFVLITIISIIAQYLLNQGIHLIQKRKE